MPPRKTLKQWTKERDAAGGVTPDLVAEYRDDVERLDATYFAREARGVARRDLDHAGTRLRWATQYPASKNMWDELPDELVVLIFLSLSFEKLMAGLRVCTRWRRLIKGTPRLWTRMAAKRWVMYTRSQGTPRLLPTATALGAVDSMVPCADNTIVATRVVHDGPWSVCRLDPKTGKVLWKKSDRVTRVGKLYGGGDTVYDFDDCTGAVHRWDVATGKSAVVRPPAVYGTAERKTTRTAAIAVDRADSGVVYLLDVAHRLVKLGVDATVSFKRGPTAIAAMGDCALVGFVAKVVLVNFACDSPPALCSEYVVDISGKHAPRVGCALFALFGVSRIVVTAKRRVLVTCDIDYGRDLCEIKGGNTTRIVQQLSGHLADPGKGERLAIVTEGGFLYDNKFVHLVDHLAGVGAATHACWVGEVLLVSTQSIVFIY